MTPPIQCTDGLRLSKPLHLQIAILGHCLQLCKLFRRKCQNLTNFLHFLTKSAPMTQGMGIRGTVDMSICRSGELGSCRCVNLGNCGTDDMGFWGHNPLDTTTNRQIVNSPFVSSTDRHSPQLLLLENFIEAEAEAKVEVEAEAEA